MKLALSTKQLHWIHQRASSQQRQANNWELIRAQKKRTKKDIHGFYSRFHQFFLFIATKKSLIRSILSHTTPPCLYLLSHKLIWNASLYKIAIQSIAIPRD